MENVDFLKNKFVALLATVEPSAKGLFGKMNVHQMIEHMGYAFRQASGLIPLAPIGDQETTEKMYRFMMSDKPFKDNTPNPYISDIPAEPACASIQESLNSLQHDIDYYFEVFKNDAKKRILNPFFGNLNHEEWNHLLYKHALHHLRQFDVHIS